VKVVYIAHPLRGDLEANLKSAAQWVRWAAVVRGVCPIAPYIEYCAALDDASEEERRLGMKMDLLLIERVDELWLCGPHVSEGMSGEVKKAKQESKPVRDLTGLLPERG